jgi:hypothetical protein
LPKKSGSNNVPTSGSIPDFGIDRPRNLNDRIVYMKKTANFLHNQLKVRDGIILHVFVRHEGFD